MALLAAAAVFVTIVMFALSFNRRDTNPVRARVAGLSTSLTFESGQPMPSFANRIVGPLFGSFAGKAVAVLPTGMLDSLKLKLSRAGNPLTPSGFVLVCLIGAGALGGLTLLMGIASKGTLDMKFIGLSLLAAGAGGFLPVMWLSSRVRRRQTEIIKTLPDSFDMITTCVEAGLGLDAALTRVAEKVKGAFSEDLAFTLREISMGRNRSEALHDMAEHTGVADLSLFVNAIIQAEQMGTSIGQVLRVQSEQMRIRRRQRAEEIANQAPVKMIFPLVLCILPTLFIVIMGPAAIQLYSSFSKGS
jgi:tight adherence protein C